MRVRHVIVKYKWQFVLTLLLILFEALFLVLFPLFIGYAIDDALREQYSGSIYLGTLGLVTLLTGAGRRFFDSRFYANVYEQTGTVIGGDYNSPTSTKTAHLGLLGEVVDFFESTMPEIINNSIGLIVTLVIIATLNIEIFFGSIGIILITMLIYGISEKRTTSFNASYNNELEKQVQFIANNQPLLLQRHLNRLMKWNIKLSDLEAVNFSVIWLFMVAFLVLSIILAVGEGVLQYGTIFSLVLYLFQFMESVTAMPLFYQQWLRLIEITRRLKEV